MQAKGPHFYDNLVIVVENVGRPTNSFNPQANYVTMLKNGELTSLFRHKVFEK